MVVDLNMQIANNNNNEKNVFSFIIGFNLDHIKNMNVLCAHCNGNFCNAHHEWLSSLKTCTITHFEDNAEC